MHRRTFLAQTLTAATAASISLPSRARAQAAVRRPRILLRSGWNAINIGDIGHTPGMLALIEKAIPNAEVTIWGGGLHDVITPEKEAMLRLRFPKLVKEVVKGRLPGDDPATQPVRDAADWADFFLLNSGTTLNASADIQAFLDRTGKPFGAFGITHGPLYQSKLHTPLMNRAKFVYFRDTDSLAYAKKQGVVCPVMEFGCDAAFAVDIRDDAGAKAYLAENGLEDGKFLTLIPRWRFTPLWRIHGKPAPETDKDKERWEFCQQHVEADHAKLREAAVAFIHKTGMKLLICPEDKSQMEIGKTFIFDKLPDDVRAKAVWREKFWPMELAIGVHARAVALLSYEMHTPVMTLSQGTPTILCRTKEQTSKGIMWRDIGLGDWLFDMDAEADGANITKALLGIADDPAAARAKSAKALALVRDRQKEMMAVVAREVITAARA